jgi:hypothetical protein
MVEITLQMAFDCPSILFLGRLAVCAVAEHGGWHVISEIRSV